MRWCLALLAILSCCSYGASFNFLVVCPIYAYSHIKFMNKVADTLAEAGHDVTLLQTYHVEHWGRKVRLAKNKNIRTIDYHLNDSEQMDDKSTASVHKYLWNTEYLNNAIGAIAPMFVLYKEFTPMCEKIYTDQSLHKMLLDQKFDGYVAEAFDFCSLYLGDHLNLNLLPMFSSIKNVPASRVIGEPSLLNYAPTLHTHYGPDQTLWDRVQDVTMVTSFYYAFSKLFDRQYNQAHSFLNGDVRHWSEILQTATFFFSNSNPYIQFAMPRLEKSIEIGGITIGMGNTEKVNEEYDAILSLRNSTVLISFGTVVLSSDMPDNFKTGVIRTFASLPDTTFIWKYENEDSAALKNLNIPDNVILKKWIPQPELLADERLSLFITHGGLGSTLEVAYSGKPSIMIPIFGDQLINAKTLSRHGGSIVYNKYDLEDSAKLTEAISSALSSEIIGANARRLAEILKNQPFSPKTNFLRHAEFSAKFGRVDSLQPYNVHYNFIRYYMLDAYFVIILAISFFVYVGHLVTMRVVRKCSVKSDKIE